MDFSEDQFQISKHYITDSIRKVYKKRLTLPILVLFLLIVLWAAFPIRTLMFPRTIQQGDKLTGHKFSQQSGISVTIDHLYFTGYTSSMFGRSNGYYYYTTWNDKCLIVLLSPSTCQEGLSSMDHVTIHANIRKPGRSYDQLLFQLSKDLNWTTDGLLEQMDATYLEEFSVKGFSTFSFLLLYLGVAAYTIVYLLLCILWSFFPQISPPVLALHKFGNPKQMLAMAEEELSTLPQLATEDMFITEHYFIEISANGVAIVPIQEIIWVYKHSTLHKFLWYHFIISYTLHITGNHHFYLRCPKNIKSDIDGIMDYLAEANHNILVGFNEENRLKVQEIQNHSLHLEGFFNFLKKHI
ncbi:MAG: hypothetical protein E7277_10365 [Lachnospiraceae bacterium]|jgi:hypothetical protein|nr:hypothetical protein [Lachnospiraceae bacterium]